MEKRFQTPDGWTQDTFENKRGRTIRYGYIFPKKVKALVCINVGLNEFCEKYFEVINDLLKKGYAISIHDWMGQGMSDRYLANPHKRHIGTYQDDVDDYFDLMDNHILPRIEKQYGSDLLCIMLAHSMGGHIGLHSLLRRPNIIAGAFFCAPLTRVRAMSYFPDMVSIPLLKTLGTTYHRDYVPLGDNWNPRSTHEKKALSHDLIRGNIFDVWCAANPILKIGSPTIGWLNETEISCRNLRNADTAHIKTPIHAIFAGRDLLVNNKSSRKFFDTIESATHETYPKARHEIMMETDDLRDAFFKTFDAFCARILKA